MIIPIISNNHVSINHRWVSIQFLSKCNGCQKSEMLPVFGRDPFFLSMWQWRSNIWFHLGVQIGCSAPTCEHSIGWTAISRFPNLQNLLIPVVIPSRTPFFVAWTRVFSHVAGWWTSGRTCSITGECWEASPIRDDSCGTGDPKDEGKMTWST